MFHSATLKADLRFWLLPVLKTVRASAVRLIPCLNMGSGIVAPMAKDVAIPHTLHRYTGDANKSAPGILLGSEYAELCKEYTDAYAKYKAASDVAKGYEAQYKKLAVPFAMAMGVSTQGTVIGPDGLKWLVKLTPKMSNASVDRQKLEALYPDAFKACDVPRRETSRTLTIKVVKK